MANAKLSATRRDGGGKGVARKLRGGGKVPAVLYGHGDRTESLAVDAHELDLLLHHVNPENTLIGLEIDGGTRADVLIREIQRHPWRPEVQHVDFLLVHSDEVLKLDIPVRLLGTPVGVRDEGGVLDQVLYELHVECLPGNIPDAAEVDISQLGIGESVRVSDISIPNVTILMDGELPVASVLAARVHDEGVEGDAADAAAEPEVLRGGAKGDEE
ncbi:MAG TPA: 50S ribosomal protein L25 [Longimicrobium sp.]|nr:50S ribosomal protein L25 [Longimicrobium sp.]